MPQFSGITDIAHSIQLAVAPVFLLSAVGAFLTVLTNRLGRIIDRARVLDGSSPQAHGRDGALVKAELRYLSARARFIHYAITLSTSCALIISLVIVTLFAGVALERNLAMLIVVLFIAGLIALIAALIFFLLEIQSATSSLRFSA
jgi:hypothetical protein